MRLPTLFKQNKNKTYGYTARYYDERKERLQALHEKHHGKEEEGVSGNFKRKVSFRDDWKAVNKATDTKKSNFRILIIIVLLSIIAYLVLEKYNIKLF